MQRFYNVKFVNVMLCFVTAPSNKVTWIYGAILNGLY